MKKKLSLLLCSVMLFGLICGCGSSNDATVESTGSAADTAETPQTATQEEAQASSESEVPDTQESSVTETDADAAMEEEAEAEEDAPSRADYPLTEDQVTLSFFMRMDSAQLNIMTSYLDDHATMLKIQELTNVNFEYDYVTMDTAQTKFNLYAASDSLPDIMNFIAEWVSSLDEAADEGLIYDMSDELREDGLLYAYYDRLVEYDMLEYAYSGTTSGRILCCAKLVDDIEASQEAGIGFTARQDYLNAVGVSADEIVTYDDWYTVLKLFQTELGLSAPMLLPAAGYTNMGYLTGGYDIGLSDDQRFYVVDGEIKFGFAEEGYKNYVQTLHQWYSEGLIYSEYYTDTGYIFNPDASKDTLYNGDVGIWYGSNKQFSTIENVFADVDGFAIVPLYDPKQSEGQTLHFLSSASIALNDGCAVAANSENAELAISVLNFMYTDTGYELYNYGVEDVTFTVDADGNKTYTDLIMNNPNGLGFSSAKAAYTGFIFGCGPGHAELDNLGKTELDLYANEVWTNGNDDAYLLSSDFELSEEDREIFNAKFADILTLCEEYIQKFIVGNASIEGEWDSYIDQMYQMGLQDCIDIYQATYNELYS